MGSQRLDFAEFYRGARDECLRAVLVSVGDQDMAQDLVDEAFARACASWRKVSRHPAPAAWVVRAALNVNISLWRRRHREVAVADLGTVADVSSSYGPSEGPVDPRIMTALLRLPARQRQVVALRLFLDLDTDRTTEMLGIAPSTVKAHLARALTALREDLVPTGEQEAPGQHGGSAQTLTYPWYPRPGQQVRIHTLGWGADGRLFQDVESIFTMPAGHGTPAINPVDGHADLTVTGTSFEVCPVRHTWGEWHHQTLTLGLSADAAGLRRQLANSQFKIIRRTVADGHKAIELGMTGLNPA